MREIQFVKTSEHRNDRNSGGASGVSGQNEGGAAGGIGGAGGGADYADIGGTGNGINPAGGNHSGNEAGRGAGNWGDGGGQSSVRRKGGKGKWAVLIGVLIVAVILAGIAEYYLVTKDRIVYGGGDPYIGVLYAEGTIQSSESASSQDTYQHDWIMARVDDMMKDSDNEGLILYVNSPGGSVYQSDELYLKLKEYKETTKRPFYVYFGETAASGGYYIAAAGDYICANRNTLTGSIGVYMGPILSAEGLLKKIGIEVDIIKSAENKAMGNGYENMTDEQKAIYQSVVDEMYDQFVSVVAEGRGLSTERVRLLGDGRVYTAAQALENGLIDRVCSFEDAVKLMKEKEHLSCQAVKVRYTPPKDIYSTLFGLSEKIEALSKRSAESEAESVLRLIEENSEPEFLYMMSVS